MNKDLKILIVDDERELCEALKGILIKGNKYEIDTSESAEEAIQKIEDGHFALILCDYKLGGDKTGLDVLFRAKEKDPNVITILMTGFGTDQLAVRAVAEGVYDYLVKPFKSILDVKNVVERGMKYYILLKKYDEKLADEESQKELLKETLEKAKRTREILKMLVNKIGAHSGEDIEGGNAGGL